MAILAGTRRFFASKIGGMTVLLLCLGALGLLLFFYSPKTFNLPLKLLIRGAEAAVAFFFLYELSFGWWRAAGGDFPRLSAQIILTRPFEALGLLILVIFVITYCGLFAWFGMPPFFSPWRWALSICPLVFGLLNGAARAIHNAYDRREARSLPQRDLIST